MIRAVCLRFLSRSNCLNVNDPSKKNCEHTLYIRIYMTIQIYVTNDGLSHQHRNEPCPIVLPLPHQILGSTVRALCTDAPYSPAITQCSILVIRSQMGHSGDVRQPHSAHG